MSSTLEKLQQRARVLEREIEAELARRRERIGLNVERGRLRFDRELLLRHRAARIGLRDFLSATRPLVVLTAPVIYGLIIPFVILDIAVTLYQWICFPVYGIPRVRRRDYIVIDRHHLAYLNALQKLNCVYCGYGNGLLAYVREVAGRTEAYWCPIKHARRVRDAHTLYPDFMDYADEQEFTDRWVRLREKLRKLD